MYILEDESGNVLARITEISPENKKGWLNAKLEEINFSEELAHLFSEYYEIFCEGSFSCLDEVMIAIASYGMRLRKDTGEVINIKDVCLGDDNYLCFKLVQTDK